MLAARAGVRIKGRPCVRCSVLSRHKRLREPFLDGGAIGISLRLHAVIGRLHTYPPGISFYRWDGTFPCFTLTHLPYTHELRHAPRAWWQALECSHVSGVCERSTRIPDSLNGLLVAFPRGSVSQSASQSVSQSVVSHWLPTEHIQPSMLCPQHQSSVIACDHYPFSSCRLLEECASLVHEAAGSGIMRGTFSSIPPSSRPPLLWPHGCNMPCAAAAVQRCCRCCGSSWTWLGHGWWDRNCGCCGLGHGCCCKLGLRLRVLHAALRGVELLGACGLRAGPRCLGAAARPCRELRPHRPLPLALLGGPLGACGLLSSRPMTS